MEAVGGGGGYVSAGTACGAVAIWSLASAQQVSRPTPYTLHPTPWTPYTLHPTPSALHPTPLTLHRSHCTQHPTRGYVRAGTACGAVAIWSLASAQQVYHPTPCTLHPEHPTPCKPHTLHPTPYTLHPTPYALHPTPYALHLSHCTLHHTRGYVGAGTACGAVAIWSLASAQQVLYIKKQSDQTLSGSEVYCTACSLLVELF